jgi:hypothetical protein
MVMTKQPETKEKANGSLNLEAIMEQVVLWWVRRRKRTANWHMELGVAQEVEAEGSGFIGGWPFQQKRFLNPP